MIIKKKIEVKMEVKNTNILSLEEIKANWSFTDQIIYKTPEIKLKSLEAAKKRVIAKE